MLKQLWWALLCGTGCAPALSSFTPAHVAAVKHVQVEVGMDVSVPTGTLDEIAEAGVALNDRAEDGELSAEGQRQLLEAAFSLLLNPPALITHVGIGVGVYEDWEVSGRLVSGGWRLGGRYQLLHSKQDGIDLSAGLGVGSNSRDLSRISPFPVLHVDDFRRWHIDVPVVIGKSANWYRWWGGPRVLLSSYHTGIDATLPNADPNEAPTSYFVELNGKSVHLGGQLGAAVGYEHVFLAAELTYVYVAADARVTTSDDEVGSFDFGTSGAVVYPALGLIGEF